ncbi:MAG TPA: VWA domain-containing protein [Polyangium sp.]|nr:VWA domain-containing protein [Polyangium sp.]
MKRFALVLLQTLVVLALALAWPFLSRRDAWESASFELPWLLLGLTIVPFLLWWGTAGQDQRTPRLRVGTVLPFITGPRGVRAKLRDLPGVLRAVSVALLVTAIARPISILRDERSEDKGIDIVVALDLSGSMRAILDAKPGDLPGRITLPRGKRLTRLDTAKIVLQDFISRRKTDRIGVVVFGKSAYVLSPPTLDYHLLSELVGKMTLDVIDGSSTAIGDGLATAVARLRRSDAHSKVIVLLTDGDNKEGLVSPQYATHLATSVGAQISTIQIGNDDEVDVEDGFDPLGQPRYVRRRYPVNPELLKWIAKTTNGEAYIATDAQALAESMHAVLDKLEKTRFEASRGSFEDLFPFLLVPGVVLVGLDALLRAWLLRRFP